MGLASGWRIGDVAVRRDSGEPSQNPMLINHSVRQATQEGDARRVRVPPNQRVLATFVVDEADEMLPRQVLAPHAKGQHDRNGLQLTYGSLLSRSQER